MKALIESLRALGFGTDRDINGAEVINTLNDHWPALLAQAEAEAEPPSAPPANSPPAALVALLELQPLHVREVLEIIPHPWHDGGHTLAFWNDHTITLSSRIETVESADLYLDADGDWYEGKPSMEESATTYHVGSYQLSVPEDFEPHRYQ